MERLLEWIRGYARLTWWDGCTVDLRLHRLVDVLTAGGEPRLSPEPIRITGGDTA